MSEAAKATFGWPADLNHAPQSPENTLGNQFKAACRCGYEGKACSTPSHAYNATKVHAQMANARDRGETPASPEPGSAPARPGTGARRASRGTPGTPCGCGCGEPSGGLFRPGHDSKLLSRLVKAVKAGQSREDALAEFDKVGASDKLRAKFISKIGG